MLCFSHHHRPSLSKVHSLRHLNSHLSLSRFTSSRLSCSSNLFRLCRTGTCLIFIDVLVQVQFHMNGRQLSSSAQTNFIVHLLLTWNDSSLSRSTHSHLPLEDVHSTARVALPLPSTCSTCRALAIHGRAAPSRTLDTVWGPTSAPFAFLNVPE